METITIAFEAPKSPETFDLILELSGRGYAVTVQPIETAVDAPEHQQTSTPDNPFLKKQKRPYKRRTAKSFLQNSVIDKIKNGMVNRKELEASVKMSKDQLNRTLVRLKNRGLIDYKRDEIIPLKVA